MYAKPTKLQSDIKLKRAIKQPDQHKIKSVARTNNLKHNHNKHINQRKQTESKVKNIAAPRGMQKQNKLKTTPENTSVTKEEVEQNNT